MEIDSPVTLDNFKSLCGGCRLYCAMVDGSRSSLIYEKLICLPQRVSCLYNGIGLVADSKKKLYPYLVELLDDSFSQWLFNNGWGKRWGVFIGTDVSFPLLRNYLAKLAFPDEKNSNSSIFPLYNPAFLRKFFSNADDRQLKQIFKYVTYYWMEKQNARPVYFYYQPKIIPPRNQAPIYTPEFVKHLPLAQEL